MCLGVGGAQPDAGKPLHQWFKEQDLDMKQLRELSKNADACGWERPNVRTLPCPAHAPL